MIHSIIQILTFQILFLAVYDLFLKKETFFNLNRIYLLLTPILGFILPFITFSFIQQNIPQEYIMQLPAVIIGSKTSATVVGGTSLWIRGLLSLWFFGMLISVLFFSWKLFKIAKLKSSGILQNQNNYKLIILPKTDIAFSFFKTIFLGENISEENKTSIIAHEKIHIQQRHSLDLLFFEILRIIFWFNPMVYLFQNRIATLHEFIADAAVTAQKDKKQYYQNLLSEVFQTEKISFINTFFNQSLIKKRIVMLQKSKSPKTAQFKYLLLLPAICGMLIYTACSNEPKTEENQIVQNTDPDVMAKIQELEDVIMEKGSLTPEEEFALQQVTVKRLPGDKYAAEKSSDGSSYNIPFGSIEKAPTYPGCSGVDNEAMKKCMSMNISQFINDNFNTKLANSLGLVGRQRIAVQFTIDKTGSIVNVRARAPKKELEDEAIRIVKLLPQMQPGEHEGKKVGVLYSLPIVFDVVE